MAIFWAGSFGTRQCRSGFQLPCQDSCWQSPLEKLTKEYKKWKKKRRARYRGNHINIQVRSEKREKGMRGKGPKKKEHIRRAFRAYYSTHARFVFVIRLLNTFFSSYWGERMFAFDTTSTNSTIV